MIFRRPVAEVIGERFASSIILMMSAWILSGVIGFVLGIVAAMKKGTWLDRIIKSYCYTLAYTPTFWMGLLVLIVFSVWIGWFPVGMGVHACVIAAAVSMVIRMKHIIHPNLKIHIFCISLITIH